MGVFMCLNDGSDVSVRDWHAEMPLSITRIAGSF